MFKSYRFWCFIAAAISMFTAVVHVVGGGFEFHQPALDSALSDQWKAAFSSVWHEVTALLVLDGIFLIFAGMALRKNGLLLWLVLSLNAAFATLFFGYGLARLGTPWVLLQWVIFVAIVACLAIALSLQDSLNAVEESEAKPGHLAVLPGANFSDAYVAHGPGFATAMDAAQCAFGTMPAWISRLMALRNAMVAPFGLVNEPPASNPNIIGMFPVLSQSKDSVLLGLNDKHLDFRLVVELFNGGRSVSLTTLVQTHHVLGRIYLTVVMPFHRIIVATILAQAVRNSTDT